MKEAERLWVKALNESVGVKTQAHEDAKMMIADTLRSDLDKVFHNTFDSSKDEVYVGSTSDFLVEKIGLDPKNITMPAGKAYSAMASKQK